MTIPGELDCCVECTGELIFNPAGEAAGLLETTMHRSAWCCVDLTPLWIGPEVRGENVIVPGAQGTRAQRRRVTETSYSLPFAISGVVDPDGNPVANPMNQLKLNIDYLRENVIDPPPNQARTRSATLTLPDGMTVLTAEVQVVRFQMGDHAGPVVRAALTILIPAGRFA